MKIETKYDAGQEVYFFSKGKIQHEKIYTVTIKQAYFNYTSLDFKNIETEIEYYIHQFGFFSENDLFASKEELLNSLK